MPRAKRPLAEVDPNASRLASSPKSSKTSTGRTRKTAGGDILEGDKDGKLIGSRRNATRNTSSGIEAPSLPKASLHENERKPSSKPKSTNNTKHRLHLPGSTYLGDCDTEDCAREDCDNRAGSPPPDGGCTSRPPKINYKTKDNSKLKVLLYDRLLPTSGTREELIARLETSTFDYNIYSSEQLTELLKSRHVTNAATGPKTIKIQRLEINDAVDRDTSNWEDTKLYVEADVKKWSLDELVAKQEALIAGEDRSYSTSTWTLKKLGVLLKDHKLPTTGTREDIINRLRASDRQKLIKDISKAREEFLSAKEQLETQIGHAVEDHGVCREGPEADLRAIDNQVERDAVNSRPRIPICDYDWRDSHWASRTERQLSEICSRRGMPGHGPKAAMLKWLDTGSVEYEDLYAGSLEMICFRRGIKHRSGEKKVDLIRRLKEADEQEAAS
jgi:hypothetical protein